ncbi:helix-loop-helix DNA-binding domain-containing protein [Hirsutella rhossiliensis]|uniref:Helix-loop-helix DNA-binding domain-containing protein n=1 Tax=Hirsutella rhossiliensis TaxID=111463 RepID=A0A9P8MTI9_9HYPO|nr:helix-loop-helix DNA-binding domain-containing protein [Hirsutella rhossiliensis]KAH0960975.1 helix-loop-helix DNA-binding domain-containing protein [Hirsutella rhossiliensis]
MRPPLIGQSDTRSLLEWIDEEYASCAGGMAMPAGTSLRILNESGPTPSKNVSDITQHSPNLSGTSPGAEAGPSASDPAVASYHHTGPEHYSIKRIAHYRVEKRYRTNISDKIRVLDEMLPRPSPADQQQPDQPESGGQDDTHQCDDGAAIKRSKGEVLSRAIDYIVHLKRKADWQEKKIQELSGRIWASRKALELGHDVDMFAA